MFNFRIYQKSSTKSKIKHNLLNFNNLRLEKFQVSRNHNELATEFFMGSREKILKLPF